MKNVVVTRQEENWQDDGGSHNPGMSTISDEDFDWMVKLTKDFANGVMEGNISSDDEEKIGEILCAGPDVKLPATIDGVFNFWYSWG